MMRKAILALIMFSSFLCPISTVAEMPYNFPDYKMQLSISDDWTFAVRGEDQVISSPKSYPDIELGTSIYKNIIGYFKDDENCVAIIEEQVVPESGILLLYDIWISVLENEESKQVWDFSMYYEDELVDSFKKKLTNENAYVEIFKTDNDTYIECITGDNTVAYATTNNGRIITVRVLVVPLSTSVEGENKEVHLHDLLFEKGREVLGKISFTEKQIDPNIDSRTPIKRELTFEEKRSIFWNYVDIIYPVAIFAIIIIAWVCKRFKKSRSKTRNHMDNWDEN